MTHKCNVQLPFFVKSECIQLSANSDDALTIFNLNTQKNCSFLFLYLFCFVPLNYTQTFTSRILFFKFTVIWTLDHFFSLYTQFFLYLSFNLSTHNYFLLNIFFSLIYLNELHKDARQKKYEKSRKN